MGDNFDAINLWSNVIYDRLNRGATAAEAVADANAVIEAMKVAFPADNSGAQHVVR